jgi:hypothetical protein
MVYVIIRSQHVYFTYSIFVFIVEMYAVLVRRFTLACGLRFLVDLYGRLEECCN